MKSLKLAVRLLYNNISFHGLLILQTILVFAIASSVVSETNSFFYQKNLIKNLNNDYYAFFQTINERDLLSGTSEAELLTSFSTFDLNSVNQSLNGKTEFITEHSIFATQETTQEVFCISAFDQKLLSNVSVPLLRGKWITDVDKNNSYIRFVTDCTAYNIGDKIPLIINDDGEKINITLIVTGIAKTPFYSPSTSATATNPDVSTIMSEYEKSDPGNYISGIMCLEDLSVDLRSIIKYDFNYHVFFDESLTKSELEENINILKRYGSISSGKEILNETDKNIYEILKLQLPDIIFISLIALVGFCGISLINISSNMPLFALYSILGCSNRKCYLVLLFYVLIIDLSALFPIIFLLISATFSETIVAYYPFVNSSTFLVVFIIALLFVIISFAFVFISFQKQSSKQILRGE
jgi:hypothetical protein